MDCPFCGKEMQTGIMSGSASGGVSWKPGEKKTPFFDSLIGIGKVTAAKIALADFTIETYYCRECHKMIFDTDIAG